MRLRDSNAALFQEEILAVCDLLLDAYNEPVAGRFAYKDNLSVLRKLDRLITINHREVDIKPLSVIDSE
jgi:hypothetical protein